MKKKPFGRFEKPGWEAQKKLAPEYRKTPISKEQIKARNPKKAGVLCLWYKKDNDWYFPLIERAASEGVHSGQISFPGGQFELEDISIQNTAIRETNEELGINLPFATELFELSELYIPPSNFLVFPFMTYHDANFSFIPEENEVASILEVSREELLQSKIEYTDINGNKVPFYELQGHVVWGATAMILNEVKEIILLTL